MYNPEEFINALRRYCKGSDDDEGLATKIVNVFASFNLTYSANLPYSAVVEYARLKEMKIPTGLLLLLASRW